MRADKYFAEQFGSRSKAREQLERGLVLLNGKPLSYKAEVTGEESFTLLSSAPAFVSEGGYKLERGLRAFSAQVAGKVFADIGASTGGFTHCLLQQGASKVFCVDVGESQLAPALACDPRVVVMDRTNARFLTPADFSQPLDGFVCDVSFISLQLILPAAAALIGRGSCAYVLFKPQFECGGRGLPKSGILPVRYHAPLLSSFYSFCVELGLTPRGIVNAPLRERKNVEYIVWLEKEGTPLSENDFLRAAANFFENIA